MLDKIGVQSVPRVGVVTILLIALAYAVSGRLGQLTAIPPGTVTAIWPPSGIALAAILIYGPRVWPGIWAGSFAVNVWALLTGTSGTAPGLAVAVAAAIGVGVSLAAVAGARGLARNPFRDISQLVRFVVLGAPLAAFVSATAGTASLLSGGVIVTADLGVNWLTWFLGDLAGILVVAPLLVTWALEPLPPAGARRGAEALCLFATLAFTGVIAFGAARYPLSYLVLPPLVLAAFRFRNQGATAATLLVSILAAAGTSSGLGSFAAPGLSVNESLLALQGFVSIVAVTSLVLATLISERARAEEDLSRAKDAAEAASQTKGLFLSNMSGVLRKPLKKIIGYSGMLHEEATRIGRDDFAGELTEIRTSGEHLLGLVDSILELSDVEFGRLKSAASTYDVRALVTEVADAAGPLAVRNSNALDVRCPPDIGMTTGDAGLVRRCLANLLANACKFTYAGAVTLEVARKDVDGERWIIYRVADTGIGMSAEQLEGLFQPFKQGGSGPAREYGGAGLGLAITQRLCRVMGGGIEVESELERGSTFTLRVPSRAGTNGASGERVVQEAGRVGS